MKPHIVLVAPKYPRNIGMVARAMANFAIPRLIIIAPQCEIGFEAREGAAQGQKPLREAVIYPSWTEFLQLEAEGPRIALSRRHGKKRPTQSISEIKTWPALQEGRPVYLIFGAEDDGLSSTDLEFAHRVCHFDLPGRLQSMNLSHAVVYMLTQLAEVPTAAPQAEPESITMPEQALRDWLTALNFDLSKQRWNALIALQQLLLKAAPTKKEITLFNNVIQQTVRRLREKQ